MMNQKLVMKARSHDPDAFTELVESELKGMYRTAYAILLNDTDAADAIQDTILTLWEKISDLKKVRLHQFVWVSSSLGYTPYPCSA